MRVETRNVVHLQNGVEAEFTESGSVRLSSYLPPSIYLTPESAVDLAVFILRHIDVKREDPLMVEVSADALCRCGGKRKS